MTHNTMSRHSTMELNFTPLTDKGEKMKGGKEEEEMGIETKGSERLRCL